MHFRIKQLTSFVTLRAFAWFLLIISAAWPALAQQVEPVRRPDVPGVEAQDADESDEQQQCPPGLDCAEMLRQRRDLERPPNVIVDPEPNKPRLKDETKADRASGDKAIQSLRKLNAEELTEFQQFIFAGTGKILPIYGYDLFEGVPTTFAPVDRVPVSPDYVIGPGDEIILRAWGQVTISTRTTVDRSGNIYIPKVGNIPVVGTKYSQLPDYLKSVIGRVFQNFDLSVTLGELRSIQVFVVGQARRPGSYTVSSLSTLVNAIFASGGPSPRGSMRHIQLRRGGKTVSDFDLYDLLVRGDKSKDAPLLPGDVIYFSPVGSLVGVIGSVNVPAIYELRNGANLQEVIDTAGGLSTTAAGTKVTLERIQDRKIRKVEEYELNEAGLKLPIKDGDLINIYPLSPRFENSITLRGNVAQPGRYPWRSGMRIRDLIPDREFLIKRDYWTNQNRPQRGKIIDQESHLPEVNWDYALIERLDQQKLNTKLLPFHLGKAIDSPQSEDNLVLEPGDIVTIYSQSDLKTPLARQNKFVRLEGEFNAAGVYQVQKGGLHQVIAAAGGLTNDAYLLAARFYRESTRIEQQRRLDAFVSQMEVEVERNISAAARNVSSAEEAVALKDKAESQRRLIEKMRQVKADGRIVLSLSQDQQGIASIPDLSLEDGDRFFIPAKPATVNVIGAVYNESSQLHKEGWKSSDYLRAAGGMTREADGSKAFVIRADGSVVNSGRSWWNGGIGSIRLMPGDTIVVPQNLNRIGFYKGLKDWTQILSQMALGAAAIQVLRK